MIIPEDIHSEVFCKEKGWAIERNNDEYLKCFVVDFIFEKNLSMSLRILVRIAGYFSEKKKLQYYQGMLRVSINGMGIMTDLTCEQEKSFGIALKKTEDYVLENLKIILKDFNEISNDIKSFHNDKKISFDLNEDSGVFDIEV